MGQLRIVLIGRPAYRCWYLIAISLLIHQKARDRVRGMACAPVRLADLRERGFFGRFCAVERVESSVESTQFGGCV
jgi:hypothetical protein